MNLYNADCLEKLKDLSSNSIDLCILDLPYGQTDCDWDIKIDLTLLWIQLKRIGKPNTAFLFFTTTKFGYELIKSNEKWFRYDLVWDKVYGVGFLNARKMPMRTHEMIYVFYNKLPVYNLADNHRFIGEDSYGAEPLTDNVYGDGVRLKKVRGVQYEPRLPSSIIKVERNMNNKSIHETQKPIDIIKWIIRYYSHVGGTVLDPTMGSGTTGVACRELERKFIGIEKNPAFFEMARERIEGASVTHGGS